MKLAAKLAIGAVALGGIVWAATAAAKSGGSSSKKPTGNDVDPSFDPFDHGNDTPTGPGGGGGGGGGGGSGGGGTPTLGPGGFRTFGDEPEGGLIFGGIHDANLPQDWNPNGNTIRFSHDCTVVLVGRQVWMMHEAINVGGKTTHYSNCVEFDDVKTCWRNGQNLCCFIDYLMNQEGITSAMAIGAALVKGMDPPCIAASFSSWPPAMQNFVEWLRPLVNTYVQDSGGQADWT